jgi:thymidine kinase
VKVSAFPGICLGFLGGGWPQGRQVWRRGALVFRPAARGAKNDGGGRNRVGAGTMSLRVVVGPMFAGKTSEIQSVVRRYSRLGKSVLVLTADIDNRYATNAIVNHDMTSIPARAVPIRGGLMEVLSWPAFGEATAVVVDEAQFFVDCLIPFVREAVDRAGKHVVVVGLDSDAEQRPFGDVLALMAHADSIEKKTALCLRCGDGTAAIFTRRLRAGGDQVAVGGADLYEPVCRRHFTMETE